MTIATLLHAAPLGHVHAEPLAIALAVTALLLGAVMLRQARQR